MVHNFQSLFRKWWSLEWFSRTAVLYHHNCILYRVLLRKQIGNSTFQTFVQICFCRSLLTPPPFTYKYFFLKYHVFELTKEKHLLPKISWHRKTEQPRKNLSWSTYTHTQGGGVVFVNYLEHSVICTVQQDSGGDIWTIITQSVDRRNIRLTYIDSHKWQASNLHL